MLSPGQQKTIWEDWLSAEIRSNYFADLCGRYQWRQRLINWLTLACSSGAFAALVSSDRIVPTSADWLKPLLTFLAAALSLWSLVAQNQKLSTDCSDLHFRWNILASQYAALWERLWAPDAPATLEALTQKSIELSKSGTSFPNRADLMEKWQDHVVRHHVAA